MRHEPNPKECLICHKIDLIQNRANPHFIKEFETGYAILGDNQFYKGYSVFLCKHPVLEPHNLPEEIRKQYLFEMTVLGEALWKAFGPFKLNYSILGNVDKHLHSHIFPRYDSDPDKTSPVWSNPDYKTNIVTPSESELNELKQTILNNL